MCWLRRHVCLKHSLTNNKCHRFKQCAETMITRRSGTPWIPTGAQKVQKVYMYMRRVGRAQDPLWPPRLRPHDQLKFAPTCKCKAAARERTDTPVIFFKLRGKHFSQIGKMLMFGSEHLAQNANHLTLHIYIIYHI